MKPIQIEVCCGSVESAINAQQGGAHRVELCDNLYEGGTTPSAATIRLARERLDIGLHVLVRPRGGDFVYNEVEKQIILQDIEFCKTSGVDGVVVGSLHPDGSIDTDFCKQMLVCAQPMSVTFHRAFDMCKDPIQALEDLIEMGVGRLLTSGQQNKAFEGKDLIKKLVEIAKDKLIVMPGSGIRPTNIKALFDYTLAREYHVSARINRDSTMQFRREGVYMGGLSQIPEYQRPAIDVHQIREMVDLLASG